jgi:hypothetical protein
MSTNVQYLVELRYGDGRVKTVRFGSQPPAVAFFERLRTSGRDLSGAVLYEQTVTPWAEVDAFEVES